MARSMARSSVAPWGDEPGRPSMARGGSLTRQSLARASLARSVARDGSHTAGGPRREGSYARGRSGGGGWDDADGGEEEAAGGASLAARRRRAAEPDIKPYSRDSMAPSLPRRGGGRGGDDDRGGGGGGGRRRMDEAAGISGGEGDQRGSGKGVNGVRREGLQCRNP